MPENYTKMNSPAMFNKISRTYDFLNHFFSFGFDIAWRKRLAKLLPSRPFSLLDVATGTGDLLFSCMKHNPHIVEAIGIDPAEKMLDIAKAKKAHTLHSPSFQQAYADDLPFNNATFDAITIGFGVRNFSNLESSFKEIYRVLKPQGTLLILEFSLPSNHLISALHLFYLRRIIPAIGGLVSKDPGAYSYLNTTIETFPYGTAFTNQLKQAGFHSCRHFPLLFGISTLYQAHK